MSTEHAPSTLAEAIAAETSGVAEDYETETVELRSLDAAEADSEVNHTLDDHAVAFEEVDLDDAVKIE